VDISGIDFPVLMLADPVRIPFLSGYGSAETGLIGDVEVAYEPEYSGRGQVHLDEKQHRKRHARRS
jgi:hypothetical protein